MFVVNYRSTSSVTLDLTRAAFGGGGAFHEARDARGVVTADTHCAHPVL